MSANFLLAGIVAGLVSGLGLNGTFDALIEGMQNILFGAMIVGFAKGIVVILENGKIIDTIVHGMTTLLSDIPASFVIIAMFILQFLLNFFIPSGSGQALTTMPLMVPISDLLHINRQLTVLAFQYGDSISNILFPTSAILMGALAVGRITYTQWIKFVEVDTIMGNYLCCGDVDCAYNWLLKISQEALGNLFKGLTGKTDACLKLVGSTSNKRCHNNVKAGF